MYGSTPDRKRLFESPNEHFQYPAGNHGEFIRGSIGFERDGAGEKALRIGWILNLFPIDRNDIRRGAEGGRYNDDPIIGHHQHPAFSLVDSRRKAIDGFVGVQYRCEGLGFRAKAIQVVDIQFLHALLDFPDSLSGFCHCIPLAIPTIIPCPDYLSSYCDWVTICMSRRS